jgi:hypothetical protein
MFRKSSELEVTYKVFAWGPEGVGKSHLLHTAPALDVIDVEHRSDKFRDVVDEFGHFAPGSFTEAAAAIRELAKGSPCKSIGIDGLSKLYETCIKAFSTKGMSQAGEPYLKTDWPAVNRTMMTEIMDPTFAIGNKNIICTGKQATKLVRKGNDFQRDGVKVVGDAARWNFYFDFVLHMPCRGSALVQKSMSPHLPVGFEIRGDLDWPRFIRLVTGEETPEHVREGRAQRPVVAPVVKPAPAQPALAAIDELLVNIDAPSTNIIAQEARARGIKAGRLRMIIMEVAGDKPLLPDDVEKVIHLVKSERAA